ncbi:MAG: hypothetical protein A3J46_06320 [Candidatus Yanofskybacteria bacterium RIFCSPHIGHO2_02_FULL_41_11]|uniref:DUF1761 domain-containing protein n=1 Tax=Candidatus Yanofskybacteria bacterium RIFCSPHIGHO2_02_FULL_41_11 TaxID=1802675 RepID=A0A1F8F4T1_9BACT|nr:MAG: hypothetical protein A3J46_06320 [Candidatus Yanofskybacteria bacterium RIFCSPHIGHO2_02_FULL_41_11]
MLRGAPIYPLGFGYSGQLYGKIKLMASTIEIDIVTIFLAAVVNMALGMAWYSSLMFGKKWIKLSGTTERKKARDMGLIYSLTFFASLVTAFALEMFIANITDSNVATGIMIGFWAGVGFVAATSLPEYLFNSNNKAKELYLINVGYHLVALMLMGGLLAI